MAQKIADVYAYEPLLEGEPSSAENSQFSSTEGLDFLARTNQGDDTRTPTSDDDGHEYRKGFLAELQDMKSNIVLRAHGHEASMQRSFSPLAALGLGFRHVCNLPRRDAVANDRATTVVLQIPGLDISAALNRPWHMLVRRT